MHNEMFDKLMERGQENVKNEGEYLIERFLKIVFWWPDTPIYLIRCKVAIMWGMTAFPWYSNTRTHTKKSRTASNEEKFKICWKCSTCGNVHFTQGPSSKIVRHALFPRIHRTKTSSVRVTVKQVVPGMRDVFRYAFCPVSTTRVRNVLTGWQRVADYIRGNKYNPLEGTALSAPEKLAYQTVMPNANTLSVKQWIESYQQLRS